MVAQSNAYKEWAKEKTVMITMRLQRSTDADILRYLNGKSKQTIIKLALREYMEKHPERNRKRFCGERTIPQASIMTSSCTEDSFLRMRLQSMNWMS